MKKSIFSIALAIMICISSFAVSATQFVTFPNGRGVPADVYKEPYAEDKFTVTYAPWHKKFNLMRPDEVDTVEHGGEACQQVRQLEICPANTDIMYFITDTSGIWKTTNRGKFWFSVNNNIRRSYGRGLICDPKDENIVYCNMREDGVYRSKNGGIEWEYIIEDLDSTADRRPNSLATDAEGNLFAAVAHGVYRLDKKTDELVNLFENDEDTKHITKLRGVNGAHCQDICTSDDGQIIYVTISQRAKAPSVIPGLYVSRDGGKSWDIKATDEKNIYSPIGVTYHPEDVNHLFMGASRTEINGEEQVKHGFGLYVSKDGGETWEKRYTMIYENKEENVEAHTVNFYKIRFGAKFPDGKYGLYIHGHVKTYPFLESYDEGYTFDRVYTPEHRQASGTFRQGLITMDNWNGKTATGYASHGFCPDPYIPGRVVYNGTGIFEYTDLDGDLDGEIKRISGGFSGICMEDFAFDSKGRMFMPATDVGNVFQLSEENYSETTYPTFGQNANIKRLIEAQFDPNDDNHLVAFRGASNGSDGLHGIYQSFDGGFTWKVQEDATFPYGDRGKFFEGGSPSESNPTYFGYAPDDDQKIISSHYTSYDNGKTWQKNSMFIMAVSHQNSQKMLGAKGTGENCEFYLSEDGGKTWEFLLKPGYSRWEAASFDMRDDNYVFVMRQKFFFKLDINAKRLDSLNSKFNYKYFRTFTQNPKDPNHIVVLSRPRSVPEQAQNYIVYESRDGGETFHGVPGFWGNQLESAVFSPYTDGDVFIGGLAGISIYNYKKYWEYLDTKIYLEIDGKEKTFSKQPTIIGDTAMVPMRELFEYCGAEVSYNSEKGEVTAQRKGKYLVLKPGSKIARINGEEIELSEAPYITEDGKTMVPTGAVWRALDLYVGWSADNRRVYITTK